MAKIGQLLDISSGNSIKAHNDVITSNIILSMIENVTWDKEFRMDTYKL